jgi:CubicO group peptidase (beta-lactamase class C family)
VIALLGAVAAASALQAALDRRVAGTPGTGIAVGVIDHGKQSLYFAGSDGKGRAADAETLFEIGSVTKTFTATALARMVLAKQIALDAPIAEFLPSGVRAPSKDGKQITLLDLAEQRSGLPRLPTNLNGSPDDPYAQYADEEMYAFLNGYTLTRDPGAQYEYSNYGVGLLGALIARSARLTYPQLLAREVLDPLAMSDSALILTDSALPARLAAGHDLAGNVVPAWRTDAIAPAGGLASDLNDMLKYLRANMGSGPLAAECLFAQQPRADGETGHQIGLIWNISSATGTISHNGSTEGFNAAVAISRDRLTGVVVLGNGPAVDDIAAHVLFPSEPLRGECPAAQKGETDPGSFAGVYCNASGAIAMHVRSLPQNGDLSLQLAGQQQVMLSRIDADTYFSDLVGATVRFVRQDKRVVGLWILQGGQIVPATRADARGAAVVSTIPSPFPPEVRLDPSLLRQYVGSYRNAFGTFTVTLQDAQLFVELSGQASVPVYASAKDAFFYKAVYAQISFNRNAAGTITSLTLHQNGRDIEGTRAP